MYGVELYAAVRLAVVEEGLSHHEAGRRFGIDRRTVKKMLSYSSPPGYRQTKPVRRPKLDGIAGRARRGLRPVQRSCAGAVRRMSSWRAAMTSMCLRSSACMARACRASASRASFSIVRMP